MKFVFIVPMLAFCIGRPVIIAQPNTRLRGRGGCAFNRP